MKHLLFSCSLILAVARTVAAPAIGTWTPIFKGIDYVIGTNKADVSFPNQHVIHAMRVDLNDPDIQLLTTPRYSPYAADNRETGGMTVSRFVQVRKVQVAVNGGFFSPTEYYLPENTPMDVAGLTISGGSVVSTQESSQHSAVFHFDAANHATFTPTNWPAIPSAGIQTAVPGSYPLVVHGVNVGKLYINYPGVIHDPNPRTALGLSQDRRFLYLLTIDGRQPGYSEGADDSETGGWLLFLGSYDGINLDGGGSTTMSMEGSTGKPVRLNRSSAVADSGRERTVGSHFGVFAKPLVAFINDVRSQPDDTAASITWTTVSPATTQVEYGPTDAFGFSTPLQTTPSTNHAVLLTGLQAATDYYFRTVSSAGGTIHTSSNLLFTTVSYVSTNEFVSLTGAWRHTDANLDGINWTAPDYQDGSWTGPDPALLWADVHYPAGNPDVGPLNSQLDLDASTLFPFVTYYFRAHFPVATRPSGADLKFTGYIDDGAVVYLNGHEIARVRMEDAPTPITHDSLAVTFPCLGDATCADEFTVTGADADQLVAGDNVLAVEVHNFNPRSGDITFGLELTGVTTLVVQPTLALATTADGVSLTWTRGGFQLQQADSPEGPWSDVAGPVVTSPYVVAATASERCFRLHR